MSEQLDLRRSMRTVGRRWKLVTSLTLLGVLAGGGYTALKPPLKASSAIVVISSSKSVATEVVIAGSTPVLLDARPAISPPMSLQALRKYVQVSELTPNSLSISAKAKTAETAEGIANAVANSYVAYLAAHQSVLGKVTASLQQRATAASGMSEASRATVTAVLGGLLGLLIGMVCALAVSGGDNRLRLRDQIADAMGIPVLAALPVWHPSDAARWMKLLDDYRANIAHAWLLRNMLLFLGVADIALTPSANGAAQYSLAVLSLSSDRGALALGPQVAAFAAAQGIPTALVIGPHKHSAATAALSAACKAYHPSSRLWTSVVADDGKLQIPARARLVVIVTVVDSRTPQIAGGIRANATVLGVSAGAVTAEQLASVATNAADDRRHIDGILVADPDPADQTTGRIPQLVRPTRGLPPARITGISTETKS
jgi:capsular polysaccharide biosynthesis protein